MISRRNLGLSSILLAAVVLLQFCVQYSGVDAASDPGDTSYLRIKSGTGSFSALSTSNKQISASAGSSVSGSITVETRNDWASTAYIALIYTTSWGAHSTSYYTSCTSLLTGTTTYTIPGIALTVPSSSGTYYLIIAFRAEKTGAQVASATSWAYANGASVWNDGNDLADFSSAQISAAQSNGCASGSWLMSTGYQAVNIPADAVTIVVPSGESSSISVTSPSSSSVWTAGSSYSITWTSSGTVGSYVRIEYDYSYYSASTVTLIVSSTGNDGSYSWTIPSDITARSNYLVRVSSTSFASVYDDSPLFQIASTSTGGGVTVSGHVYDKDTQLPISGAKIFMETYSLSFIQTRSALTNDAGYYFISDVDPDEQWSFDVSKTGYLSHKEGYLTFPDSATKDIYLSSASDNCVLKGYVSGGGSYLVGASVSASGPETRSTSTDSNGFYTMDLSPGTYTISVSASGYASDTYSITLSGGDVESKNFYLQSSNNDDATPSRTTSTDWNLVAGVTIGVIIVGAVIAIASKISKK